MATTDKPREEQLMRGSRAEVAEILKPLLSDEPKSAAQIGREAGFPVKSNQQVVGRVRLGLSVLQARDEATNLGRGVGWVRGKVKLSDRQVREIEFPYKFEILPLEDMFIDKTFQRPLTGFMQRVAAKFDPKLIGTLVVSDRGRGNKEGRYSVVDGQTRWQACREIGVRELPCVVFGKMSVQDEARMFADLQRERRGMTSWDRFRAELAAGDKRAKAVLRLTRSCGYELGNEPGQIRAIAALEVCFDIDEFMLERTLTDLKAAFDDRVPDATLIRGLHTWFRDPNEEWHGRRDVDDEKLVRRLKFTGMDGLHRKSNAAREIGAGAGSSGGNASGKYMAMAIENVYRGR